MTTFSLREAAEHAGTSKSTIFRAIKAGRLSAARTDDGGFAIDPAELFRVYPPKTIAVAAERIAGHASGQDAPGTGTPAVAPEIAIQLAALEVEVKGLRELLAEIRSHRDELRSERDDWRNRAERLLTDQTQQRPRRSWWNRLVG